MLCVETSHRLGAHNPPTPPARSPPGGCHTIYSLLCGNGTDANPDGLCNVELTPREDLFRDHPEWFWPHDNSYCTQGTTGDGESCVRGGGDCQPACQNIQGVAYPLVGANGTYGQVCWHNASLVQFLIGQVRGSV